MILSKVEYDNGHGYALTYCCQSCEKEIQSVGYDFCPHCGAKLEKDGQPGHIDPNDGEICGLIALAVTNGGFKVNGKKFIQDGASCTYEHPSGLGMTFASWSRKRMMEKRGGAK